MNDEEAGVCPLSPSSVESLDKEERAWLLKRQEQRDWRVDHGAGYYQEDRQKKKISYLVETGKQVINHKSYHDCEIRKNLRARELLRWQQVCH
jgi:DNA polymerase III psi subunit